MIAAMVAALTVSASPMATNTVDPNVLASVRAWFPMKGDVWQDHGDPVWQYKVTAVVTAPSGSYVYFVIWPSRCQAMLTLSDWRTFVAGPPPFEYVGCVE